MTGGAGSDRFNIYLDQTNDADVTISDFDAANDRLDLRTFDGFLAQTINRFDRDGDGALSQTDGDQVLADGDAFRAIPDFVGDEAPTLELRIDGLTLNLLDAGILF